MTCVARLTCSADLARRLGATPMLDVDPRALERGAYITLLTGGAWVRMFWAWPVAPFLLAELPQHCAPGPEPPGGARA